MRIPYSVSVLAGFLLTVSCATDSSYFGKTTPPEEQRLFYINSTEPETVDPAKAAGRPEGTIIDALFEGLTRYHAKTLEPMAGLATHYETNSDNTQFTFYLRGHPNPRGIKLPNTDTLRLEYEQGKLEQDFSRGHSAPPDNVPARWSDGRLITAQDLVYSWRRVIDPETAADYANMLYYIRNAEEINLGKVRFRDRATGQFLTDRSAGKEITANPAEIDKQSKLALLVKDMEMVRFTPDDLAVRALDDFTFQVDMRAPTAFFVKMQSHHIFFPVPRHAIEAARRRGIESSWVQPENIVSSGPFTLQEWKPYDRLVIAKNPRYFEADLVFLQEITFLPIVDNTTAVNLYKAGVADAMAANAIPQPFISVLRRSKKDFFINPALSSYYYLINVTKPPFDNVLLRYALNMATDKEAEAAFLGAGEIPALNLVPPIEGYETPQSIPVEIGGKSYDVLAYNPEAAREILAKAGFPNGYGADGKQLEVDILFNSLERHKLIAEIVQQQWQENLNIDVELVSQEWKVYQETLNNLHYKGVARRAWNGDYVDPNSFLDMFVTGSVNNGSGWEDSKYDAMLAEANSTIDPALRLKRLTQCETYLLKNMPFVPLHISVLYYLRKPYVRGLGNNILDKHVFKYVWIEKR